MNIEYKYKTDHPYSLHDMVISKIIKDGSNIILKFENGFEETKEPYRQIDGDITIENVDFDFVSLYKLSENGSDGKFEGNKISNINNISNEIIKFEVVDELYSYNIVQYNGFAYFKNDTTLYEVSLSIYHFGNIIYNVKKDE